jgi:hypothetical protein
MNACVECRLVIGVRVEIRIFTSPGVLWANIDLTEFFEMIPESLGTTPFGVFSLADEYFDAAKLAAKAPRSREHIPARFLAYHASELFLKCYLRFNGEHIKQLRSYDHDLETMLTAAHKYGLTLVAKSAHHAALSVQNKEYTRVRYPIGMSKFTLNLENALSLANEIRESVRMALDFDEWGQPLGNLWANGEPDDYLEFVGRPWPSE